MTRDEGCKSRYKDRGEIKNFHQQTENPGGDRRIQPRHHIYQPGGRSKGVSQFMKCMKLLVPCGRSRQDRHTITLKDGSEYTWPGVPASSVRCGNIRPGN